MTERRPRKALPLTRRDHEPWADLDSGPDIELGRRPLPGSARNFEYGDLHSTVLRDALSRVEARCAWTFTTLRTITTDAVCLRMAGMSSRGPRFIWQDLSVPTGTIAVWIRLPVHQPTPYVGGAVRSQTPESTGSSVPSSLD